MSREEFLAEVEAKIIADRVIDPMETIQNVLGFIASHIGNGKLAKVILALPKVMQSLSPALASAA